MAALAVKIIRPLLCAAVCGAAATASAVTITFGGFGGTFPYSEGGFLVTPTQTPVGGSWSGGAGGIGTSAPQNLNVGAQIGTIQIALVGGGLFFFNDVSLRGATAEACDYSITGWLSGTSRFTENGGLNTYIPGNPYNFISGNPAQMVDTLFITLYSNPEVNSYFSVANIDVTPVPEASATAVLLGVGATALLVFGRAQRRMAKL